MTTLTRHTEPSPAQIAAALDELLDAWFEPLNEQRRDAAYKLAIGALAKARGEYQ